VVTRAIHAEMLSTNADHVYLDMTHLSAEYVQKRFPRIYSTCKTYGIDITGSPIPVSLPPTTSWAASGPTSGAPHRSPASLRPARRPATGVHGANRLASNSLLEGWSSANGPASASRDTRQGTGRPHNSARRVPRRAEARGVFTASTSNM